MREEIDRVDRLLVRLLNRRVQLADKIGRVKREEKVNIFDPSREGSLWGKLDSYNRGPLSGTALCAIYREILSECRARQGGVTVGWVGSHDRGSWIAAVLRFGVRAMFGPAEDLVSLLEGILQGRWAAGVVKVNQVVRALRRRLSPWPLGQGVSVYEELRLPMGKKKAECFWVLSGGQSRCGRRLLLWCKEKEGKELLGELNRLFFEENVRCLWKQKMELARAWLYETEFSEDVDFVWGVGKDLSGFLTKVERGSVHWLGTYSCYELLSAPVVEENTEPTP